MPESIALSHKKSFPEQLKINTRSFINASLCIPGSKSYTNRALIPAAFAEGTSILKNVLLSDDTLYMMEALKELGLDIHLNEEHHELTVHGGLSRIKPVDKPLFVGNAGTAFRFLSSFLAAVQNKGEYIISGNDRMKERPIKDLVDALISLKADISYEERDGFPPLRIKASGLHADTITMKGNISSQYLSSILLSGAYADDDFIVKIDDELVSEPYIDMTIDVVHHFGGKISTEGYKAFKVKKADYLPKIYIVESDYSSASYFFAAAAITKGKIRVLHCLPDSLQADKQFLFLLEQMGATVTWGNNYVEVSCDKDLQGIDADMNLCPDVAQTLAVVALFAKGKTTIHNVANMRVKETDRLSALHHELVKLGATVEEWEDGLSITPSESYRGCLIETYDDHRMAMSFALAGLKIEEVVINNPGCVSKTFPNFFDIFNLL